MLNKRSRPGKAPPQRTRRVGYYAAESWRVTIPTALASFTALLTRQGVREISYRPAGCLLSARRLTPITSLPPEVRAIAIKLSTWLRDYAAGRKPKCRPPLDLRGHTAFRLRVWRHLRQVRFAATITYGQLARQAGCRAARAVGSACGANPLPLLIPCHRVVAKRGLGGWSGKQGWKEIFLGHEARLALKRAPQSFMPRH